MITEKKQGTECKEKITESEYEFGIIIEYDGKKNTLFYENTYKNYPIGGILCECMRVRPTTVRDAIRDLGDIRIGATDEDIVNTAFALSKHFYEVYPPAAATMLAMQFYEGIGEWGRARKENRLDEYIGLFQTEIGGDVFKFIFEDTPYDNVGDSTVEQVMLSIYLDFARCFVNSKYIFMKLFEFEETKQEPEEGFVAKFFNFYGNEVPFQHIDYRLALIDGRFASIFTIHSILSLLMFEFAHILDTDAPIVRCKNCGEMFAQEGRSDTVYCSYPSPQKPEKTCGEIGAQIARANKEKTDIVTREYRKVYMRYQMKSKRHPENTELIDTFYALSDGMREWRKRLKEGSGSTDQFFEWLHDFE